MSVREILAELPRLSVAELAAVEAKLRELHRPAGDHRPAWGYALLEVAGTAEELPDDYAANHDHYLHDAPKR
jgi:hypothetical protein